MFYTKEIQLLEQGKGYLNDKGVWIEGGLEPTEVIKCDIQPYTNDLAYKHYGYEGNVSYKIYAPLNDKFSLDGLVNVYGKPHRIVVALNWDDYCILVVSDKHDK